MKHFTVSEYITPQEAEAIIQSCPKERDQIILRTMWETGGRVSEVLSLIPDYIDPINNCIYLPNLKQNAVKRNDSESDDDYKVRRDRLHRERKPPLKRVFLFPESTLCHALLQWAKDNEIARQDWIFPGRSRIGQVSATYVWYLLSGVRRSEDKWKRRDGLATSLGIRKIKKGGLQAAWPHTFRHGMAMLTYHRTGRLDIVQKQLGHSSVQTTETYAQLTDDDRRNIINKNINIGEQ